jgi:hypothetical protein
MTGRARCPAALDIPAPAGAWYHMTLNKPNPVPEERMTWRRR